MQFDFCQQDEFVQNLRIKKEVEANFPKLQQMSVLVVAGLLAPVPDHQLHGCEIVVIMVIAA